MDRFLNIELLKNPVNWAIVWAMVLFAAFALYTISVYAAGNPTLTADNAS
jgi:hypothetical protein